MMEKRNIPEENNITSSVAEGFCSSIIPIYPVRFSVSLVTEGVAPVDYGDRQKKMPDFNLFDYTLKPLRNEEGLIYIYDHENEYLAAFLFFSKFVPDTTDAYTRSILRGSTPPADPYSYFTEVFLNERGVPEVDKKFNYKRKEKSTEDLFIKFHVNSRGRETRKISILFLDSPASEDTLDSFKGGMLPFVYSIEIPRLIEQFQQKKALKSSDLLSLITSRVETNEFSDAIVFQGEEGSKVENNGIILIPSDDTLKMFSCVKDQVFLIAPLEDPVGLLSEMNHYAAVHYATEISSENADKDKSNALIVDMVQSLLKYRTREKDPDYHRYVDQERLSFGYGEAMKWHSVYKYEINIAYGILADIYKIYNHYIRDCISSY